MKPHRPAARAKQRPITIASTTNLRFRIPVRTFLPAPGGGTQCRTTSSRFLLHSFPHARGRSTESGTISGSGASLVTVARSRVSSLCAATCQWLALRVRVLLSGGDRVRSSSPRFFGSLLAAAQRPNASTLNEKLVHTQVNHAYFVLARKQYTPPIVVFRHTHCTNATKKKNINE